MPVRISIRLSFFDALRNIFPLSSPFFVCLPSSKTFSHTPPYSSPHCNNLHLSPPFFHSLLLLSLAVFFRASKFNHTWCNRMWAGAPISKSAFLGSSGLSFCCFPGRFFNSSTAKIITANDDSFQCTKCPAGRITTSPNVATTCDPCDPGEYQDELGQFKCKPCASGKWSNVTSLSSESGCLNCTAGKYSKPNGADSIEACVDCQPGKKGGVAKTGASDESSCTPCNAHTYSEQSGQTSCIEVKPGHQRSGPTTQVECSAGKYGTGGNATCQNCDVGQFQDAPGSTTCRGCPSGWANKNNGSSSCNAVPAGFYTSQGKQSKCERGFTCAGADKSPEPCPNGTYTNSTGSVSCIPCSPGTFASSPGSLKCKNCPAGWLQSEPMKSFCEKVARGNVVAKGRSVSIQVPLGSRIICVDGSNCTDATNLFEACGPGTHGQDPPSNTCLECSIGYSSSKAAIVCQAWCVYFSPSSFSGSSETTTHLFFLFFSSVLHLSHQQRQRKVQSGCRQRGVPRLRRRSVPRRTREYDVSRVSHWIRQRAARLHRLQRCTARILQLERKSTRVRRWILLRWS